MAAIPEQRYTLAEYIELDKNSEERLEYFEGQVVSMSGGSLSHNRIARNLTGALMSRLTGRVCEVLPSEMRVKVPKAPPYRYADLIIVCGNPLIETVQGLDVLVNPSLMVEILSESTEAYDRGNKFRAYQSIDSFKEYLLVAQNKPYLTQYVRQLDGHWMRSDIEGLECKVELITIDLNLPLSEIYNNVELSPSPQ